MAKYKNLSDFLNGIESSDGPTESMDPEYREMLMRNAFTDPQKTLMNEQLSDIIDNLEESAESSKKQARGANIFSVVSLIIAVCSFFRPQVFHAILMVINYLD